MCGLRLLHNKGRWERSPVTLCCLRGVPLQVVGALVSVLIIWLLTGVLVYEAITRIVHPTPVKG